MKKNNKISLYTFLIALGFLFVAGLCFTNINNYQTIKDDTVKNSGSYYDSYRVNGMVLGATLGLFFYFVIDAIKPTRKYSLEICVFVIALVIIILSILSINQVPQSIYSFIILGHSFSLFIILIIHVLKDKVNEDRNVNNVSILISSIILGILTIISLVISSIMIYKNYSGSYIAVLILGLAFNLGICIFTIVKSIKKIEDD